MSDFIDRIGEILWPRAERRDIWMIVDAARDQKIFPTLLRLGLEYSCLYSGAVPAALENVAPYLVQLEYQDRSTQRLLNQAWGNSWGILLKCDSSLEKLRRHLRRFLVVQNSVGDRSVFRYYDPRVLRLYLPTCTSDELEPVFGPIGCFWTEGESAAAMFEFRLGAGKLAQETIHLDSPKTTRLDVPPSGPSSDDAAARQRWPGTLTIREAQLAAFSRAELQKFEDWMVIHLNKFFPQQCKSGGDAGLRETIRRGIERARAHGVRSERDVCKYIDLMMVLGHDFDSDPRLPWAAEILQRERNAEAKINTLHQLASQHLKMNKQLSQW